MKSLVTVVLDMVVSFRSMGGKNVRSDRDDDGAPRVSGCDMADRRGGLVMKPGYDYGLERVGDTA